MFSGTSLDHSYLPHNHYNVYAFEIKKAGMHAPLKLRSGPVCSNREFIPLAELFMIVTVFRSRLNPETQEEYGPMAKHMSELVRSIPGYISHKGFTAEDGERVTIVEFESEEALREWRIHPEHAKAKRRGIESFFDDYKIQICSVIRDRSWTKKRDAD